MSEPPTDLERDELQLTAADGAQIGAYHVRGSGNVRAGLVVLQEIFGVNRHIRDVADGYAAAGHEVIAPALFDRIEPGVELGYDEAGMSKGRTFPSQLGFDKPLLDVAAAVAKLAHVGKVGLVGYCWGGSLAYLAAARVEGLHAVVGYYGTAIAKQLDQRPRVPVLLHFGQHDKGIPADYVAQIRAQRPELEVHVYDAGHGFNCDQRGSYEPTSAELARSRTLAFFARHLA